MRVQRRLLLVAGLSAAGCAPAPPTVLAPVLGDSARFEQLVERYVAGEYRAERDSADPLARYRAAAEEAELSAARTMLDELAAIDTTALDTQQRIDWLLLQSAARRSVADTVLRTAERVPSRYITLGNIYWQVAGDTLPTAGEWADVLRTLERAPAVLAIGRERLRDPPPLWIELALGSADGFAAFLDGEMRELLRAAPDSLHGRLVAAAKQASDALRSYVSFLTDTLTPGGPTSWMAGAAYYDRLLEASHFLPYSAETMIAEGHRIHRATKAALDSLARAIDSTKHWRELVTEMQTRHPEPGSIMEAYRRESRRVQALLVRDDLIRMPPCEELHFVPTPPALRKTYAWAGYGGLRERDRVLYGRFFVTDVVPEMTRQQVDEKLRAQNYGWISVIALHEGYPGHHLQNVYARRHPRPLRRRLGNSYFGEGWALYAEQWMRRAGLFETADQRLALLQMRLWRTARVIIDPSLHTGRMSYDEAVQFFVDEVGLTRSAAEAEVNRYTTWPGQAPSYVIGWLEIERLKVALQAELGGRFDERRFHETLLRQGSLPLALMRRAVWEAMAGEPGEG